MKFILRLTVLFMPVSCNQQIIKYLPLRSTFILISILWFTLIGFGQTRSALFIGNSYTEYNTLPQIVANIAASTGKTLIWNYNAPGGYTLEQHSNNSTTLNLIRNGGWNYVILQEFSQYPSEPLSTVQANVFPYASYLNSEIKSSNPGAKTMFYMTWGRKYGDADRCSRLPEVCTYEGMDNLTRDRYMMMGQNNQAEVSPVGAVWRYIRENYPSIDLYTSDNGHPSEAGSYAAACCFYAAIFRSDPTQSNYDFNLSASVASTIRQAAKTVVYNNLSSWYIGNYDVPDNQAPTAPTGLTSSNETQTSVTLSWTASTDNIGVTGYYVYKNGALEKTVAGTTTNITGLIASTPYSFNVRAFDAAGNLSGSSSSENVTLPDTQAPAAPAGLSFSNLTETGFLLSWTSSFDNVGVTGYNIYQNGLFLTSVSGTSVSVTGLSPSTIYGMTVTARDAAGNYSNPSIILNVTTPDTHAPSPPTNLTSSNVTQTSFTLSWAASSDNVGVVGYEVYRNGVFETNVTNPTIGISGLIANTTYAMTVQARDAAGNLSSASTVLNVTTLVSVIPDIQAPSAPTGLSSGNITQTSFLLSWTASTDNIGVTGYDVYRNGTFVETVSGTSASISGLSPGTTYTMSVRAKDAAGNLSVSSSGLDVTTLNSVVPDTQAPSVPTGLYATGITQTSFILNWIASADNITVAGYDVFLNSLPYSSVTATSSEITGLSSSTTYYVAVRARDAADNISNLSAVLNVTTLTVVTPDTVAPSVPNGLASSSITESGFTLTWEASTDNIGVSGYEVLSNGNVIRTVGSNAVTLADLNASTTYNMTVRAKDAAGNTSAPSAVLPVRTSDIILPDTQAPTVPKGLNSGSITETGFTLTWNASTDDVGVTGYDVYLNGGLLNTVSVTNISLTGLSAGTVYTMTLRARDAANNISAASNAINVRTADNHAPSAPSGLSRSGLTESSFTLNWTASNDNVGVVGYDVYRNGIFYTSVTGVSSSINGLSASTLYSMTVRARDAAGNVSAASPVLDVITPDTQAPTVPTGLASSNISQSSFTLSWSASIDNVRVTSYDIYMNGIWVNSVTGTTVGVTGLSPYTTYAMTVRAKDAAGNVSNASVVLNVTTLDIMPPTVPSNLSVSNLTQSGFRLNWTASTDNVRVTGYYVYQDGVQIAMVTTNSANVTGLNASTRYMMTVRARDAAGNTSAASSSLSVLTPDTQAPNAPSGLNASNLNQTSFTLTWSPSTDNVAVTGYNIYQDGILLTSVTGTAAGISGLAVARTYVMTVRAKDAANNISVSSAALNVTTPDTEGPTAPGNLVYSNLTQSGFTLNWTASTDNVAVTGYNIYDHGTLLRSVTGTTITLTGLAASKTYDVTVRARDAAGNLSDPSSLIKITTPDTEAPTVPAGLMFTNLTQSGFILVWIASTDNVRVTEYEVYQDGILLTRVTAINAVITGLRASKTYAMTVRARDAAGNYSVFSAVLNVTTPDTEAPTVPVGLTSENITESWFTLSWKSSTDNVGVSVYEIFKDGALLSQVTDTFSIISDLATFRRYNMTVRAKDAAGNTSLPSESLTVQTRDLHEPTKPQNLSVSQLTDSSFILSWSPSEDNVGVTFYEVYSNHDLAGTSRDTVINLTGLKASTLYALTVTAADSAGNVSAPSIALRITTPDTQSPGKPAGLLSEEITNSSFLLKWHSSWDNVGVVQYEILQNDSLIAQVTDTMYRVSGLIFNTTYQMSVRARDAAGNISEYSDRLEVTTDFPGDPGTITVFPNPVRDNIFYVDLGRAYEKETFVELIDQGGKIHYRTVVDGSLRLIQVNGFDLPTGNYFVRVFCDGNVYTQKILIDDH